MKNSIKLSLVAMLSAGLFIGCGSSSSSDTNTGYFIDSAVEGTHYTTTSGLEGDTDEYGRFQYRIGDEVEISLGKIILGKAKPSTDGKITPRTLIEDTTISSDEKETVVTLMLQMLQSLDSDNNTSNGITITSDIVEKLSTLDNSIDFTDINESYLIDLDNHHDLGLDEDYDGHLDVNATVAHEHFQQSENQFDNGHKPDENNKYGNGSGNGHNEFNLDAYSITSTLTQELKDSLAHMGNEERLAYDVYTNLYNYYKDLGTEIKQFTNIATKSESKHISIVQDLVKRYDLNVSDFTNVDETIVSDNNMSASNMPSGVYDISAIQDLYDDLLALGKSSQESALKVGCMVEVTDINDLDTYVTQAEDANATDIKAAFENLRNGSYNHYWAFDKALKNIGVTNGCYYESDELLTNKNDIYPQNEHGEENGGNTNTQGTGHKYGKNR